MLIKRANTIGGLLICIASLSLAYEGLDYKWILRTRDSSPERTMKILQDIYDGSDDIYKPKKMEREEVGKLLDYSKLDLMNCNVEYFERLMNYASSSNNAEFKYGDQIAEYLWEQKNKLRDFCQSNGLLMVELPKLPEDIMKQADELEGLITLINDNDFRVRVFSGTLKYMKQQSPGILTSQTPKETIRSLFNQLIEPICELVLEKKSRVRFMMWYDDYETLGVYLTGGFDSQVDECKILMKNPDTTISKLQMYQRWES